MRTNVSETLFKQVNYTLGSLIEFIGLGQIGLPDLQRPFVWKDSKVRDLFDSMYKGYPVGYLLFWANANIDNTKGVGTNTKQKSPTLLIVDGQQRLTSLYAVIKGHEIIRESYIREHIVISFKPLEEKFEIPDAATRKSPEYIHNISELWKHDVDIFEITDNFVNTLRSSRDLTLE